MGQKWLRDLEWLNYEMGWMMTVITEMAISDVCDVCGMGE